MPLVRFGYARAEIKLSGEWRGYWSNIKKNFKKEKEKKEKKRGIYTNDVCFALISSLQQYSSKRRHSSKEATATQGVPRSTSIWFCPLLHLFVFPPVRNWSEFLGAPAYQQTASNWSSISPS